MISPEIVARTWQRMAATPPYQAQRLIDQMRKEQPVLLAYLLAVSEQPPFNAHEGQIVFYVGTVVWQIMKHSPMPVRKVTQPILRQAEKANEAFLTRLASDTEADFVGATKSMLATYPEPAVLSYVMETLMDEEDYDPDDPPIREQNRGMAFLHLKIVLDAFIARRGR